MSDDAAAPTTVAAPVEKPPEGPPAATEEVKSKPAPPPALEFHVVKGGYVQRQGHLWRNWYRQWMTLDEGGACLRWYKTDTRAGNDGTLFMSKCADVCDPRDGVNTTWPEGTEGRCFVVCSPNRAHYIIAESAEEKTDWMAKLTEAKTKFNTTGVGIVSVNLFSVEALKVSISSEIERAQGETDRALAAEGTSTEQIGQSLDKTVQDAEKELKTEQVAKTTEQVAQQETEVKIEAAGGDTGDTGDAAGDTGDTDDASGDTGGDTGDAAGDTGDTGDAAGDTGDTGAVTGDTGDVGETQVTTEDEKTDDPPAPDDAGKEE